MSKFKYPRTPHLPCSQKQGREDLVMKSYGAFEGKTVVITEKLDGENTTIYADGSLHARSLNYRAHESRNHLHNLQIKLPPNHRICGENMYAFHSIFYTNLLSLFIPYSVWCNDICLSFEESLDIVLSQNLFTPTIYYWGPFYPEVFNDIMPAISRTPNRFQLIDDAHRNSAEFPEDFVPSSPEGFVIRNCDSFKIDKFQENFGKCVLGGFNINEEEHWFHKKIIRNRLLETGRKI